jgi:stringent starvation protein B
MAFEVSRKSEQEAATEAATPAAEAPTLTAVPPSSGENVGEQASSPPDDTPDPPKKGGRPTLTRIK